jgi:hypothetical protein
MNRFEKMDDLVWCMNEIHEAWFAERLSEDLQRKYPTAKVDYEKSDYHIDKAYPIYMWYVEIIFNNIEDEALFILRESA